MIAVIPGTLFQPSLNPVSESAWDSLNEKVYTSLLRFQHPDTSTESKVVVVEVDDETVSQLGWPLDRSHYIKFLERMHELGHPWILSHLWWEALATQKNSPIPFERRVDLDQRLEKALEKYGRFVGSGLKVVPEEEPNTFQEEVLVPRVFKMHPPSQYLPSLPLKFMEADQFTARQAAFGVSPRLGTGSIHCATIVTSGVVNDGSLSAMPSSTVWAAALATGRSIHFGELFVWNEGAPNGAMQVGGRHCLTSPSYTTEAYFTARKMPQPISFSDVLKPDFNRSFAGKVVILARTEGAVYAEGPGIIGAHPVAANLQSSAGDSENATKFQETRSAYEHVLNARFLDGLISGHTITRPHYHVKMDEWGPVAVSIVALLLAMFLPLEVITMVAFGTTAVLLALGAHYLYQGQFEIPTHTIVAALLTGFGWLNLYFVVRAYAVSSYLRFTKKLRRHLSECNSLEDIESETQRCLQNRFRFAKSLFEFDRKFYSASSDKEALAQLTSSFDVDAIGDTTTHQATALPSIIQVHQWIGFRLKRKTVQTKIEVNSDAMNLGSVFVAVKFDEYERFLVESTLNFLCDELAVHWNRVKMLIEQKVKEYKLVEEKTRSDVMSRFLSQAVLSKFSGDRSVEDNLDSVLNAKAGRAALLQADIRGYSQFSAHMKPMETVNLLRLYYRNVVDVAQQVAQVKLIGDCIFLFIERGFGTKEYSPADLMLQISCILVRDTIEQNQIRAGDDLHFGIAIHYGDVVVGNLSSDQCIDYTVIGPNVNQVARMEELTKQKSIQDRIGLNGIIMSEQARKAMVAYKNLDFHMISLPEINLQIRSFGQVKTLYYLTAEQALTIVDSSVFGILSHQEKFAG